VNCDK